jgi:hypothetical protein
LAITTFFINNATGFFLRDFYLIFLMVEYHLFPVKKSASKTSRRSPEAQAAV